MRERDDKHRRHRLAQARYQARLRAGAAIYPVPLGARELDKLIALRWLREGDEINRTRVGEAVATMIRNIAPLDRTGR
jgi:hypothetical protein